MDGQLYTDKEGCAFVGCAAAFLMAVGAALWSLALFLYSHLHFGWSWK